MEIVQQAAPSDSLLSTYRGGARPHGWGHYGDCFSVTVAGAVTLQQFVFAFYTTWPFKLERAILGAALGAASTDAQALGVARGTLEAFSVWRVGARTESQLLMCDRYESTRSWFRILPVEGGTVLQFGSAVATSNGGGAFRLLLGFHVLYSRILLRAAAKRVMAQRGRLKPL